MVFRKRIPTVVMTLARAIGLDAAVAFSVSARLWQVIAATGTVILMTQFFSRELQGYYYTIVSLLAIQGFLDLGLSGIIVLLASHESAHLVTQEFWTAARRVIKPGGVMIANLILDGRLETPYARNLLTTIDSVFGRCAVEVLHKAQALANVEVTCFASSRPAATGVYVDEKNRADLDLARSR